MMTDGSNLCCFGKDKRDCSGVCGIIPKRCQQLNDPLEKKEMRIYAWE